MKTPIRNIVTETIYLRERLECCDACEKKIRAQNNNNKKKILKLNDLPFHHLFISISRCFFFNLLPYIHTYTVISLKVGNIFRTQSTD